MFILSNSRVTEKKTAFFLRFQGPGPKKVVFLDF